MRRLEAQDDVDFGLAALVAADPRLGPVAATAGPLALRRTEPGFSGLARIVVGQQLSIASARAIWTRLEAAAQSFTPEAIGTMSDAALKAAGLSAAKIRTVRAICAAIEGGLDLDALSGRDAEGAIAELTEIVGIGPWTAEIYLLFCLGHPDIFPAGDLALQIAAADALALPARPSTKEMRFIAEAWSPWRGVAATLFWAYYRARREGRQALPV